MASEKKAKQSEEPALVEEIVTCACTHSLQEHADDGCGVEGCDCEVERSLLMIGKVQALDEIQ